MKKSSNGCAKAAVFFMSVFLWLMTVLIIGMPVHAAEEYAAEPVYASPASNLDDLRLGGVKMQLLDGDGAVLEEWTSDARSDHPIETPLVLGKEYTLHMLNQPEDRKVQYIDGEDPRTVSFTRGQDTLFTVRKDADGRQFVEYRYRARTFKNASDHMEEGESRRNIVPVTCYRSRTLTFGCHALGTAADPDEYFEVILEIPSGIPGQIMNVDLSNADADRNPSQIVIPENGAVKESFWLKDGQTVCVDGFPLSFPNYYTLYENCETLDEEGYITKILTAEDMDQTEGDYLLIQGIDLIGRGLPTEVRTASLDLLGGLFRTLLTSAFTGTPRVLERAIDVMTAYATEEMFAVEDPAVETEDVPNTLFETLGGLRGQSFSVSDTLSDGVQTTRTASKMGRIPNGQGMLVGVNAVFGNGRVLFINRRDGVRVIKEDDAGHPVEGAGLQVLDSNGSVVYEFDTDGKEAAVVALAPGEYTLRESKAPDNYRLAQDVAFTVVDHETVQVNGTAVDALKLVDTALVDIDVTKVWEDGDDADGLRPGEITITLYADGEKTEQTLQLTEKSGWTGCFEDLPKYRDGEEIAYTVEEEVPAGYRSSVGGTAGEGFTITNTHKVTEPESTEEETSGKETSAEESTAEETTAAAETTAEETAAEETTAAETTAPETAAPAGSGPHTGDPFRPAFWAALMAAGAAAAIAAAALKKRHH